MGEWPTDEGTALPPPPTTWMSCGGTLTGDVMALGLRSGMELGVVDTVLTMGTGPPTSIGSSSELLLLLLWLPVSSESLLDDESELLLEELGTLLPVRGKGGREAG